nr:MAG TPA: hypothetical protein [Caudoviricetes sp.]
MTQGVGFKKGQSSAAGARKEAVGFDGSLGYEQ